MLLLPIKLSLSYLNVWLYLVAYKLRGVDMLLSCQAKDFHYDFTECDKNGGRWRVSVPNPNTCMGGAPNPPTRVNNCTMSCEAGTYYNLTTLECLPCPPGTYSLGGGVKFDVWDHIPDGFHVTLESFESSFHILYGNPGGSSINCSEYAWKAKGHHVASEGGPCASSLSYSVKLVKSGSVSYTYQYTDEAIIFNFEAQNDQCQTVEEAKKFRWPQTTEEGQWKTVTVPLRAGLNVLYWKTVGLTITDSLGRKPQPIRIKNIQISGVAYTSECTFCEPGTFSAQGSKQCLLCPENTFSKGGGSTCQPCDPFFQYAPKGSSSCINRPPCTADDFYEIHTPCDEKKATRVYFKWVEPKICRSDLSEAMKLPQNGDKKPCPPCNPGMEYSNKSICAFCAKDHYSNGSTACRKCPPNTAPNNGLFFNWWHEMPPGASSRCISLDDVECNKSPAWQPTGNHIQTTSGHADSAFLVLSVEVPGFKGQQRVINGKAASIGRVGFTFELICSSDCYFAFVMTSSRNTVFEVQSWKGGHRKQHFNFEVSQNDSYVFSWAFQKEGYEESKKENLPHARRGDMAKIFDITITNTINGGASECHQCPQGKQGAGCIPCAPGHYILDKDNPQCIPCPPNYYISDPGTYGPDACKPCGPGLKSSNGQNCYSDCQLQLGENRRFNLTSLPIYMEVEGSQLFTASGTQYFHLFNISLCGPEGSALCQNNITFSEPQDVKGMICRSTIVPPQRGHMGPAFSTQSVSLGDNLIGITTFPIFMNITVSKEFLNNGERNSDIHFFYRSYIATTACKSGRTTTITLRCDKNVKGEGLVTPPKLCPDGTCDGCSFSFLWRTPLACRICSESDYQVVKGECVHGEQMLHYISPKGCLSPNGQDALLTRTQPCTAIPLELQVVIGASITLGVALFFLVLYFWKKNRKLEYKYMKLVQSSTAKDGELPAAESCAIDDDDDEQYDSVAFNDKGQSLLGKFRTLRVGNNQEGVGTKYETIHLTKETVS